MLNMKVKVYAHHDDEFGIAIQNAEDVLNILYIPSVDTYLIDEYGLKFDNLSDLLVNQGITGESVNEIIEYVEPWLEV